MRIVFWGSECVSTVTSNMLILAAYLACRKGYRITLLETERQEICKKFSKKYGKYAHSYINTLVERQLYHVPAEEWCGRSEEERITMIKYLETNMDMVFIHMAERTDTEARSIMRNGHLLVMNMKQEWRSFDRYYARYANLSANVLLLIGNYYYDTGYGKEQLQEKYRICDGQLMVIPHNPRYEMVQSKGGLERYMRHGRWRCRTIMQGRFYKEIGEVAEYIIGCCSHGR